MNLMADAANKKSQQPNDQDADDMPRANKKKPKQVAAAKEQDKAKGKIPPKAAAQDRAKMPKPGQGGM